MLWFELSLENAFKLKNREKHLMDFVPRNGVRLVLLTHILKASHLVKLVKVLIIWSKGLDYFHMRD